MVVRFNFDSLFQDFKHTIKHEGTGDHREVITPIIELPTTSGVNEMINNNHVATEVGDGVLVQNGLTTTQTHTKAATGEEVGFVSLPKLGILLELSHY